MRISVLQHVLFEGPGAIARWASTRGHQLRQSLASESTALRALEEVDLLVILGGPMGVEDEERFPWLALEKSYIRQAVEEGKPILGICLGAQILASVLGAQVYRNREREIGWFEIETVADARGLALGRLLPPRIEAFHWHGDTFDVPQGATALARSAATPNQAFVFEDRVLALQFHLESTPESVRLLIENCGGELKSSTFVQTSDALLSPNRPYELLHSILFRLLDELVSPSR